jgi:tetratricopeptide (TPR) repeat protein
MKPAAPPLPPAAVEQGLVQAIGHYNAGRRPQALALCDALLAAVPEHPALHQLRARLCLDAGDAAAATEHIERSLQARPAHEPSRRLGAQAWFARSLQAHDAGDRAGEGAALDRAVALWPEHVEAWVNRGIWLQAQGRLDEALRCHGRAYRLRADCFGRIANALCSEPAGALWLDLDALRATLAAQPA